MSNYPLRRLGKYNGTILECNAWAGWHLYNPRAHSVAITTTSLPSRALLLSALDSRLSALGSRLSTLGDLVVLRRSELLSDEHERAQLRGSFPSIFIAVISFLSFFSCFVSLGSSSVEILIRVQNFCWSWGSFNRFLVVDFLVGRSIFLVFSIVFRHLASLVLVSIGKYVFFAF